MPEYSLVYSGIIYYGIALAGRPLTRFLPIAKGGGENNFFTIHPAFHEVAVCMNARDTFAGSAHERGEGIVDMLNRCIAWKIHDIFGIRIFVIDHPNEPAHENLQMKDSMSDSEVKENF
jgi:hypothetical protein